MKKFEYRILNMSEVAKLLAEDKAKNFVEVLNILGHSGWQFVLKLKDTSYLFMREING